MSELASEHRWPCVFIHDERCRIGGGWDPHAIGCIAPEKARLPSPSRLKNGYPSRVMTFYECDAARVADLAWIHAKGSGQGAILVVDELDRFGPRLDNRSSAYKALHHGRGYSLDVFGTARRPATIDKAFLSEASEVALFHLEGHRDLETLEKCGWPRSKEIAKAVTTLEKRKFIIPTGGN